MVSKLSLTIAGTQCSGPTGPDDLNRRSSSAASRAASGLISTMALSAGPCLSKASMRFRYVSDEGAAGQAPGLHRRVDLRDGGFFDDEGGEWALRRQDERRRHDDRDKSGSDRAHGAYLKGLLRRHLQPSNSQTFPTSNLPLVTCLLPADRRTFSNVSASSGRLSLRHRSIRGNRTAMPDLWRVERAMPSNPSSKT